MNKTYNTAVTDETKQVQTAIALLGAVEALFDVLDILQLALADGLINADNILPDDTPSANIEMSNLAVAHQTLRQAHGE